MRARANVLELAVLGLLLGSPMHGYELRKRLNLMLGPFRAFSYGTLYPCLRDLSTRGLIVGADATESTSAARKRARIVYTLTARGQHDLEAMLGEAGPASWEDENFDVRFAFFAQTDVETRLRILEGRRIRMAERLETLRLAVDRIDPDSYMAELQRHGIDQVEREVRWLDGLIDTEHARRRTSKRRHSAPQTARTHTAQPPAKVAGASTPKEKA